MVTVNVLQKASTLGQFSSDVQEQEQESSRFELKAYDLELYPDGSVGVEGEALKGQFLLSDEALRDLGQLGRIPSEYSKDCDREHRSYAFNRRLRGKVPAEKSLVIAVRDDIVDRVWNRNLLPAPRLPIVDMVSNSIPKNVTKEGLRVISHAWNGVFDISILAQNLACEPRRGDIVAFGVNVSEGEDGAVQVQGASFRCVCNSGAVIRICDGRRHRLRRPINRPDREAEFLRKIGIFAREASTQWSSNAEGLAKLTEVPLEPDEREALRSRLRQAPFFLSAGVVDRVLERLELEVSEHEERPSLYDLWNSMTFLGSHDTELSPTYRRRLRFGAGEFTRHESRICSACRQLLLSYGQREFS